MKTRESKVDKVLKYMHENYDDEFEFVGFVGGDSTASVTMKSKKFPEGNIQVNNGYKNAAGEYDDNEFRDNYVYIKFEDQTRKFLKEFLEAFLNVR